MKKITQKIALLAASSLLALSALPSVANAHCPPISAGSATISCEQGVRVIRQSPGALPRISLEAAQQAQLERERLAAQKRAAAQQARIERERLALEQQRINNESYLYRDANSPLRKRRGARGVVVVNSNR
ncbi:MAG: hypothetical protein AAFP97_12715 [Pseudomonadota bacterium]